MHILLHWLCALWILFLGDFGKKFLFILVSSFLQYIRRYLDICISKRILKNNRNAPIELFYWCVCFILTVCYTHILQQWFRTKKNLAMFKVWFSYYAAFARVWFIMFLAPKKLQCRYKKRTQSHPCNVTAIWHKNRYSFVKIILLKSGNCVLTLQKRRFCDTKEPLLPCKTYAFGMRNNRFYNILIMRLLNNNYACEKYLQHFRFISAPWICWNYPIKKHDKYEMYLSCLYLYYV